MVELSVDTRRDRILAAAKEEFAQHGFAGARVQRIVDRARVNKQLVFYYFGSKVGLYRRVMEQSWSELQDTTGQENGENRATMRLRLEMRAFYSALIERPHLMRLVTQGAAGAGPASHLATPMVIELEDRFSRIISHGQVLGYFREDADPDAIARHAVSLILGHLCLETLRGVGKTGTAAADQCCDLLLRGLEW